MSYAADTWDKERRVIVKAEHTEQGENSRFVVTNLQGDGQTLYEQTYGARGEMENRLKEQQLGLFADRTSCHVFLANQFRVLLSAAAYVLMEFVRRVVLHLGGGYPLKELFEQGVLRLRGGVVASG